MSKATPEQVQEVFEAWKKHRSRPDVIRFTADRQKLIKDRLNLGYAADDFAALFDYVFTSDEQWPVFMRSNDYTGLDYLLRKEKLADRVERALVWKSEHAATEKKRIAEEVSGLSLGVMGQFRRSLSDV
jgi:hypothetical protein